MVNAIQVISVACVTKFVPHSVLIHRVERITGIVSGNVRLDIMALIVRRFVVRIVTTRSVPNHLAIVSVVQMAIFMV